MQIIGELVGKLHDALVQRGDVGIRILGLSGGLAAAVPEWSQNWIDLNAEKLQQHPARLGAEQPVTEEVGTRKLIRKPRARSAPQSPYVVPTIRNLKSTRGGARPAVPAQPAPVPPLTIPSVGGSDNGAGLSTGRRRELRVSTMRQEQPRRRPIENEAVKNAAPKPDRTAEIDAALAKLVNAT